MAKVIIFSKHFPKGHPKAGKPTCFVERFFKSIELKPDPKLITQNAVCILGVILCEICGSIKHHTIRQGNRFKKGEYFSPRVWNGEPYRSKQIILADDVEIKNVWNIEIYPTNEIYINGVHFATFGSQNCELLANNDGLEMNDFINWFSKLPFKGQIICWSDDVQYN